MKKKYIVISSLFPSEESFRGPFIYDQVKAIKKTGKYDIIVLHPKINFSSEKDYSFKDIKVFKFRLITLPSYILPSLFTAFSNFFLLKKIKSLGIKLDDIEIAHGHDTSIGFLLNHLKKKNSNIKTILHHHGFDVLNLNIGILSRFKFNQNYLKNYGVNICNKIDLHIGVSERTLNYMNSYENLKAKRQLVLYNGVDLEKFSVINKVKIQSKFLIGCIANFWPLKNQITLLKAAKTLIDQGMTDLQVIFIGSGPTLEECINFTKINKIENHVEFRSETPHDELVNFYNSIDLFVLPSYWEAFGCVYVESWACGTPFIAVKNQGISELLIDEDKDKWLIDKEDYINLAFLINNFRIEKPAQFLNKNVDINVMINMFLSKIEVKKLIKNE